MPDRPPIAAVGRIVEVLEPGRLYRVEMDNGYRAYAIIEKRGPAPPVGEAAIGRLADLRFSPFDLSKCRIAGWR